MITKLDIHNLIADSYKDDSELIQYEEAVIGNLWFNKNSLRLTKFGFNLVSNFLKLKTATFEIKSKFLTSNEHLILSRALKSPYYIDYKNAAISVVGEAAISELGLFGDVNAYIEFLSQQTQ